MGYNRDDYARIREEYSKKYLKARELADSRLFEIHAALPEVFEIDRVLSRTGVDIMDALRSGKDVQEQIARLEKRNEGLLAQRSAIIEEAGYAADYTDVRYECERCGDTGFLEDASMCDCMRRALVRAGYESSGLGALIGRQTFENFDLGYYPDDARSRMKKTVDMLKSFAEGFTSDTYSNFILMGRSGLGKTHLTTATAQRIIDKGNDVLYVSAVGMMNDFEQKRFGSSVGASKPNDASRYYDADLLIIDDLGTEVVNKFTQAYFYDVINTRMNLRRSTIISTNLTMTSISELYSERITSRILGEYQPVSFVGTDIRRKRSLD